MTVTETTWSCTDCSTEQDADQEQVDTIDGVVCDSCSTDYVECAFCGQQDHTDFAVYADTSNNWYCRNHDHMVSSCDHCGTTVDHQQGDDYGDGCGLVLCMYCRDHHYVECHDCGDLVYDSDAVWSDRHDAHFCEYHAPTANDVESYNYRPCFRIFGRQFPANRTATTFGVELEVEYKNANEADVNGLLRTMWGDEDVTFLKSDGSLSDGVEAVSHPMTLDFARRRINHEALASLSSLGVRSWNTTTCGLHIHIGRDTFRNHSHLARFMILFTRSKQQIIALAGRDSSQWANFELGYGESMVKQAAKKEFPATRYRAINLTNDDTVEIRVFRGSLNPHTIIAHMELLSAMIEYTRENRQLVGISTSLMWESFRGWLHIKRNEYPAAQNRCVNRTDRRI